MYRTQCSWPPISTGRSRAPTSMWRRTSCWMWSDGTWMRPSSSRTTAIFVSRFDRAGFLSRSAPSTRPADQGRAQRRSWWTLIVPAHEGRLLRLPATRSSRQPCQAEWMVKKDPAHKGPGELVRDVTRKCQFTQHFLWVSMLRVCAVTSASDPLRAQGTSDSRRRHSSDYSLDSDCQVPVPVFQVGLSAVKPRSVHLL